MYIEKETIPDECSCNNPDCNCSCNHNSNVSSSDTSANFDRWNYLFRNWDNLIFEEKMAFFLPTVIHINPYNSTYDNNYIPAYLNSSKKSTNDASNSESINTINNTLNFSIVHNAFMLCRNVQSIKYEIDHTGVPNVMVIYAPVDVKNIPDSSIKSTVIAWGTKFGFIK